MTRYLAKGDQNIVCVLAKAVTLSASQNKALTDSLMCGMVFNFPYNSVGHALPTSLTQYSLKAGFHLTLRSGN